jgi:hypothetical protein
MSPTPTFPSPRAACLESVRANLDGKSPTGTIALYSTETLSDLFIPSEAWHVRITLASGSIPDLALNQFGSLDRGPVVREPTPLRPASPWEAASLMRGRSSAGPWPRAGNW